MDRELIIYELIRILNLWREHGWSDALPGTFIVWAQESAGRTRYPPRPEIAIELLEKIACALKTPDGYLQIRPSISAAWTRDESGIVSLPEEIASQIVGMLFREEECAATLEVVFALIPLVPDTLSFEWDGVPMESRREPAWIWLQHLGLCQNDGYVVRCAECLRPYVSQQARVARPMTQAELDERLKAQCHLAMLAEEYVVAVERHRLRLEGHDELAEGVYRISVDDVSAGFDVLSFESNGALKRVEVKASTGARRRFFLSENELTIAKAHSNEYWLAWIGFAERLPSGQVELAWFRNPADIIEAEGGPWLVLPDGVIVERHGDDLSFCSPP